MSVVGLFHPDDSEFFANQRNKLLDTIVELKKIIKSFKK
jgi:hypothetical protein